LINPKVEYVMAVDQLSSTFAALADPTRRAILERLTDGDATVGELAAAFPMSLQAVSKHLRVLERAGLITRGRTAQWRPCRLDVRPLEGVADWLERYRRRRKPPSFKRGEECAAVARQDKLSAVDAAWACDESGLY
jgi:DNA-binding transcriptional ArsR family regulator